MQSVTERILARSRKGLFRARPIFDPYMPVSQVEIDRIAAAIGVNLPADLTSWLLSVGYGDVDEVLSFRADWFARFEEGRLGVVVIFAQDELGNFYRFRPSDSQLVFLSRSAPEYALVAPSFQAFMEELERRDFRLIEWMEALPAIPYKSDA